MARRWSVGILALHAPVSELIQGELFPQRSGDPRDVVADVTGMALAMAAWLVWKRLRR